MIRIHHKGIMSLCPLAVIGPASDVIGITVAELSVFREVVVI